MWGSASQWGDNEWAGGCGSWWNKFNVEIYIWKMREITILWGNMENITSGSATSFGGRQTIYRSWYGWRSCYAVDTISLS